MRKPLSYFEYYRGNKKKTLSLIISIAFSVVLIGSIQMFLNNVINSSKEIIHQYEYFTLIESTEKPIEESFMERLRGNKDIQKIIPTKKILVQFNGLATNSAANCYIMDRENISYLVDLLNIDLDKSTIPQNSENNLLLNRNLIKNNKLKVDDEIKGSSGIKLFSEFEGKFLTGFVAENMNSYSNGFLIVPKEGKLEEVNKFIRVESSDGIVVTDFEYFTRLIDTAMGDVAELFNIVTVIVLFSIGIGLGISTYVHYYQRRKEFGVMSSIGYTHKSILLKINKEILITSFAAFMVGLLLLYIEMHLMNKFLLENTGTPLFQLSVDIITRSSIIPLFTSAFSLIPTWVLLKKIDSISIIEGVS